MVTCTGHIGIHEGADGRTYVRCTDVHDVMAIKPNFLTSMGYHIFLSMVLRARAPSARAELRYNGHFDPVMSVDLNYFVKLGNLIFSLETVTSVYR